jgi:hypothetical protein
MKRGVARMSFEDSSLAIRQDFVLAKGQFAHGTAFAFS